MKDWIADAALGALALGREREFLAHTADCVSCREAYKHAREVAAFVDRGVESLVNGVPSPHFTTRLRARIAAEPAPARFHWAAWATSASALAFAAILLILLTRGGHTLGPHSAAFVASQSQPSSTPTVTPNLPTQPVTTEQPSAPHAHRAIRRAVPRTSEPEVLVQPGELAAVRQFVDSVRAGRVDGAQIIAAQHPLEKPLELNPIEIPDLDAPKSESESTASANNSSHL